MSMLCGLDLHRQQITFDALVTASGEVWRGRVCGSPTGSGCGAGCDTTSPGGRMVGRW